MAKLFACPCRSYTLSLLMICALLLPRNTQAGNNSMAMFGKILGAGLIVHGAFALKKDTGTCVAPAWVNCWKIPLDVLEIAGGAYALLNNSKTEEMTREKGALPPGAVPPPGAPGGPDSGLASIPDTCKLMPESCKCKDNPETCKNPNITLPPLPTLKANLANAYKNNPGQFPDGFSLDDALNSMDDNYKKADDAVAAFNSASDAGLLGASDTTLADGDGEGADGKHKSEIALGTGRSTASGGEDGASPYNFASKDLNLDDLLKKMRKERGDQVPAKAVGLNLEDGRSGRLLTLFERVSRAIRGPRDRDIVLAKMEWSRREILKKLGKSPTLAAPHSGKNSNFAISSEKQ